MKTPDLPSLNPSLTEDSVEPAKKPRTARSNRRASESLATDVAAFLSPSTKDNTFVVPKRIASQISTRNRVPVTVMEEQNPVDLKSSHYRSADKTATTRAMMWAVASVAVFLLVLGWGFSQRSTLLSSIGMYADTAAAFADQK